MPIPIRYTTTPPNNYQPFNRDNKNSNDNDNIEVTTIFEKISSKDLYDFLQKALETLVSELRALI